MRLRDDCVVWSGGNWIGNGSGFGLGGDIFSMAPRGFGWIVISGFGGSERVKRWPSSLLIFGYLVDLEEGNVTATAYLARFDFVTLNATVYVG